MQGVIDERDDYSDCSGAAGGQENHAEYVLRQTNSGQVEYARDVPKNF